MQAKYRIYFYGTDFVMPLFLDDSIKSRTVGRIENTDKMLYRDKECVHSKVTVPPKIVSSQHESFRFSYKTEDYNDWNSWYSTRERTVSGRTGIDIYTGRYLDPHNSNVSPPYQRTIKKVTTILDTRVAGKYILQTLTYVDDRLPTRDAVFIWSSDFDSAEVILPDAEKCLEYFNTEVAPNIKVDKVAKSNAFREAVHTISPLNVNNIATLKDIGDLASNLSSAFAKLKRVDKTIISTFGKKALKLFKQNNKTEFIKSFGKQASSAWLSYRYVYTTTKLDIQSYYDNMGAAIASFDAITGAYYPPVYGRSQAGNSIYTYKVLVKPNICSELQRLWQSSDIAGLNPNLVNLWDMIPFSFIVDWFLPIQELCSIVDDKVKYSTSQYNYLEVLCSTKTNINFTYAGVEVTGTSYTRMLEDGPPELFGDWEQDPSTKTVTYRCADAASLIISSR